MPITSHPLLDHVDGDFACTETRAGTVFLSEGLTGFLQHVAAAGMTPVLISPADARLTFAARFLLESVGCVWVLRTPNGFVDTRTGGLFSRMTDLAGTSALTPRPHAPRGADASHEQAFFGVTVQHRALSSTALGMTAEILSTGLTGVNPASWGVHEPAAVTWSADSFTGTARRNMPGDTRYVISGADSSPFQALALVHRNGRGVEETVSGAARIVGDGSGRSAVERLPQALVDVANALPTPVVGTISLRLGREDLTTGRGGDLPAFPVASIIGPRAVRDLGIDVTQFQRSFPSIIAGRRRIPSLVVVYSAPGAGAWEQMRDVVASLGGERIRAALGFPPQPGAVLVAQGSR